MRIQRAVSELQIGDVAELSDGSRKHITTLSDLPLDSTVTVVGRNSVELLPNGRFRLYGEPIAGID